MKTALVIGNGIVGACVALALQRAGLRASIIDPGDEKAAASYGNAGHLAIEQVDPLASSANVLSLHRRLFMRGGSVGFPLRDIATWLPFGWRLLRATAPERFALGQRAMASLLAYAIPAWQRVATQAGAADLIRTAGHWVVWESSASAARGLAAWQAANTGAARIDAAISADVDVLRAQFNGQPVAAARFTGTGQILDLHALRRALQTTFIAAGGELLTARVGNVGDGVTLEDGTIRSADVVVVAAGVGASQLLLSTFGAIPLIAERGYHIETTMDAHAATPGGLPVVFEDRNVILSPYASSFRLSGFSEFSRTNSPPDPRKWAALQRHAKALGLPMAVKPERWVGSRPTLPDYLPAIGQHPSHRSLFYAFAHNHLGLTLAAITGELIASLVEATTPRIDLSPFALERFK